MSTKFNKSVFVSGNDINLCHGITLHHPTIGEILALNDGFMCDEYYWNYVNSILCDPYYNMVMLDDIGINFMEVSNFDVLIIKLQQYIKNSDNSIIYKHEIATIIEAINFFIVEDHNFTLTTYDTGDYCLVDINDTDCQINKEIFDYICEWIGELNKINNSNRINPADENARRILIEDTRDEIKRIKRKHKSHTEEADDYIGSLMSASMFCGSGNISPFSINDCKIYWIFEAVSINTRKSNSDHVINGIYSGTVDASKINKKELDWIG